MTMVTAMLMMVTAMMLAAGYDITHDDVGDDDSGVGPVPSWNLLKGSTLNGRWKFTGKSQ